MQSLIKHFDRGMRLTTMQAFRLYSITSLHTYLSKIKRMRPDLGIDSVRVTRNGRSFNCYIPFGVK